MVSAGGAGKSHTAGGAGKSHTAGGAGKSHTAGAITDVPGIAVGHHHRIGDGWATGVTVVLAPPATVGAVDIRGGGPGTRETDLLDPANLVQHVDAVALCGGSAYGLAAADGVMRWLAERGRGFPVGARPHEVVPIVPAAVLFDLPVGERGVDRWGVDEWGRVPDATFGYAACDAATEGTPGQGSVGAGAGATAGRLKGGIGTASTVVDGVTIGALVAVNSFGEAVDLADGVPFGAGSGLPGEFGLRSPSRSDVEGAAARLDSSASSPSRLNTTIGVVATDAELTRPQCRRLAMAAHDGLARAVRPAHTLFDGDTVFALATGAAPAPPWPVAFNALVAAVADTFARAVVHGVLSASSLAGVPDYCQLWPSALE